MSEYNCRICESKNISLVKKGNIPADLSSKNFQITDSDYGVTGDIFKCSDCGFLQCLNMADVLPYYQALEDKGYEETRTQRALQERSILKIIKKQMPGGRLLDVGAGSGILVEEALAFGYKAMGLEPSTWLYNQAKVRNLPVLEGIFPDPRITDKQDIITIIDVIEHVPDPVLLLKSAAGQINEDGIIVVSTPDVSSFFARIFSYKWWHFRIAHIGYFSKKTLKLAGERAGLKIIEIKRPAWYFSGDYLFSRIMKYFPKFLQIKAPKFLEKITVPLNLFDSLLIVYKKQ